MHIPHLSFLVVEDHEFQRGVVLRILAGLGATNVCWAADGRAALRILETTGDPVDIVISDLAMPGMDGMEFIRHLGKARIPVSIILASGSEGALLSSVETMSQAYGVTILGTIEKPVTPAKLGALIKRHPLQPRGLHRAETTSSAFTLEEIREGLRNDEFEAYFQPKVELASGRITGAEALARWRHPRQGVVPPAAFIDMLEENGLIDELMWAMLSRAAAFCGQWRAVSGLDVTVSVNLSSKSLADVRLADRVTAFVDREHLAPQHMILEVTESATLADVGPVLENLSRLRMHGFGLSIDDYGTGYSSMQQLMRIAFTELKIDHSFVGNAAKHASARLILESSIDLAKKLNIASVAEGIETQQEWDLLHHLGCELAQGYFIARPMEAAAFMEWTLDRARAGAVTP